MLDDLSSFMPIWKLEAHFKCPIVGAVLSVDQHRNILKKCGYNTKRMKPYEYHQQLMAKLNSENNVSIKVNNYLRQKARKMMIQISNLPDDEVEILWKKHLESGKAGPMMYAIISHEKTGVMLLQDVFGQMHMHAHANMTEIFNIKKKLVYTDQALIQLQQKISIKDKKFKELMQLRKSDLKTISILQEENRKYKADIYKYMDLHSSKENFDNQIFSLKQKIDTKDQEVKNTFKQVRILEREKKSMQVEIFGLKNENELIQKQFRSLVNGIDSCTDNECPNKSNCIKEACCPQYKLCAKRIFMIGGITRMKSFYRDVVENAGGRFDYHDGYLKGGQAHLEARVKRCDMVVCPVNCNSHNACLKVKKLCSKYNKTLKFLQSSSLSAVANALLTPNHNKISIHRDI